MGAPAIKNEIIKHCKAYGTGRDTLRCLALATIDAPPEISSMNLEDSTKFIQYETNMILYVDVMSVIFQITPLNLEEWVAVIKMSFPVILIDEALKYIARRFADVKSEY